MHKLNLPICQFRFQNKDGNVEIFDVVRKKFIVLTPEEWVRQHFIHYLINQKGFPPSLIQLEKPLNYNQLEKRSDIVVYDKAANPVVLVECKSPQISIIQDAFDQIARYNFSLKVKYLIVTNGINHFCCKMDYETISYSFIPQIPLYKEL
ncbi:MAG: type I restriction enzyme HsdR N-terminal domain-containing protein [Bacteroidetes bacterium]|nr:type I restriction enzyme HsdR N-terminal domain-containing protein [Bacteroidota bacterium]